MQTDKDTTTATESPESHSAGISSSYGDTLLAVQTEIEDWQAWTKKMTGRKKPHSLRKLLTRNCLLWGIPTSDAIYCANLNRLFQLKNSGKPKEEFDWNQAADTFLATSKDSGFTVLLVLEAIAWAHALPALASRLEAEQWAELLASLLHVTQPFHDRNVHGKFARYLLTSELPFSLGYQLPELAICKKRIPLARKEFDSSIDAMLDGEGMPHANFLAHVQALLASATRILTMDDQLKKGGISKPARLQIDWLCRQTLRWARPDGSQILATDQENTSPNFDELMKYALKLTNDETDFEAYRTLRGKRKTKEDWDLPPGSEHSEWSEAATMRTDWATRAIRLAVSFSGHALKTELAVGKRQIFSGTSSPRVTVDGEDLEFTTGWEEVCWETDDDMDFIEIEAQLTNGWQIQRQMLLARADSFALISDAVSGPNTADIRYRNRLPMRTGIQLEQPEDNTEAMILGEKRLGTVIPISLSEWKVAGSNSRLRTDPAGLEISQRGRGLFAPLFIDLDPSRRSKAMTWRSLTVAESLHTVPADVAVAYRVQIGKSQWVIYRSLAQPGNRTFLGQNRTSEFFVARFGKDGETETILDVSV